MFPQVIEVGPLRFSAYAILLGVGLVGGAVLSVWRGPRRGLAPTTCFDAALFAAIGGLIGARAAYVAANWAYYRDHIGEGLRLWAGGLAWLGGLVLAVLLVALCGARFRLSLGTLYDALTLGLAWFSLFVWLGSGAANDVYGRETFPTDGLLWTLSADLPDLYGLRAPRLNVPLLGIIWSSLVFIALWFLEQRPQPSGSLFLAYLALTGLGGTTLVLLQANAVPFLFNVRIDWLVYLLLLISGLAGLGALRIREIGTGQQA